METEGERGGRQESPHARAKRRHRLASPTSSKVKWQHSVVFVLPMFWEGVGHVSTLNAALRLTAFVNGSSDAHFDTPALKINPSPSKRPTISGLFLWNVLGDGPRAVAPVADVGR